MNRVVVVMVMVAGAASGSLVAVATNGPAEATRPASSGRHSASVVSCDADGFRYVYHVPTGHESLFELAADPRQLHDVLAGHKDVALGLRRKLEARLSVRTLDDLRVEYAETIKRLRSLGYL